MVKKLNYKKYLNYPDEVTEDIDSTIVETMNNENEKDKKTAHYLVDIEYDQNQIIA